MAREKKTVAAVLRPKPETLWLGPEGIIYDSANQAVVFADSGLKNSGLLERMVESTNALAGFSMDQIRRGDFKGGFNTVGNGDGCAVVAGNGNNTNHMMG